MATDFDPIPTVESWQLSNAPILAMAALRASLNIFTEAGGIGPLREKTKKQLAFFDRRLDEVLGDRVENITPGRPEERGCQYALRMTAGDGKRVFEELEAANVLCDWREPDVIRVAPVPLYNSFADIERFIGILDRVAR